MTTQERLMTVDEFEQTYMDRPYELIEGVVVKVSPTVFDHGYVTAQIAFELNHFIRTHPMGVVVGAETGFKLSNITMRAPDAAYISKAKLVLITDRRKFLPFAPDLAVEVVSPTDRKAKLEKKIELFMSAGTSLLWIIHLKKPRVIVYQTGKEPFTVPHEGTLDGGDVLPGLQIRVADLFPPIVESKE